jgi:hypothetical protein
MKKRFRDPPPEPAARLDGQGAAPQPPPNSLLLTVAPLQPIAVCRGPTLEVREPAEAAKSAPLAPAPSSPPPPEQKRVPLRRVLQVGS